jgi:hypothetical protein
MSRVSDSRGPFFSRRGPVPVFVAEYVHLLTGEGFLSHGLGNLLTGHLDLLIGQEDLVTGYVDPSPRTSIS